MILFFIVFKIFIVFRKYQCTYSLSEGFIRGIMLYIYANEPKICFYKASEVFFSKKGFEFLFSYIDIYICIYNFVKIEKMYNRKYDRK